MTVSIDTILAMLFSLLVSFVLPIVLLIVLKRKLQVPAMGALVGAGGFILFVLVLEQIAHWAVLSFTPVRTTPWAYVLYGCLAAGVFEETGRLIMMKIWGRMRGNLSLGDGILYGVGHGGAEAILLVAGSVASTLFLSLLLNVGGVEALTEGMTGETLELAMRDLETLTSTSAVTYLIPGVERLFAILFQIALSVLIFLVVNRSVGMIWYPVAILMHAVANLPAMLYQAGILQNVYLVEGLTAILVAGGVLLIYYLWRGTAEKKPPQGKTLLER